MGLNWTYQRRAEKKKRLVRTPTNHKHGREDLDGKVAQPLELEVAVGDVFDDAEGVGGLGDGEADRHDVAVDAFEEGVEDFDEDDDVVADHGQRVEAVETAHERVAEVVAGGEAEEVGGVGLVDLQPVEGPREVNVGGHGEVDDGVEEGEVAEDVRAELALAATRTRFESNLAGHRDFAAEDLEGDVEEGHPRPDRPEVEPERI